MQLSVFTPDAGDSIPALNTITQSIRKKKKKTKSETRQGTNIFSLLNHNHIDGEKNSHTRNSCVLGLGLVRRVLSGAHPFLPLQIFSVHHKFQRVRVVVEIFPVHEI